MAAEMMELEMATPSSSDQPTVPRTQPRAYQLEMFDESMKRNLIVTIDTGSGKTQIQDPFVANRAKLRIEAELQRCSSEKLVWFLAPNVVLAEQQYRYFSDQLPAYSSRLVCGSDNPDRWNSRVWLAVLQDARLVVSTPQILFDALQHDFVRMRVMALLVFDEAHHCVRKSPMNRIMKNFYHIIPTTERSGKVPHILGLTASPITNDKAGALEALEHNLDAVCRAPRRHLEELQNFVHKPHIEKLMYSDQVLSAPEELQRLRQAIEEYNVSEDPYVKYLENDDSPHSHGRLQRILIGEKSTHTFDQLEALRNRASVLNLQLGSWASIYFLQLCRQKVRQKIELNQQVASLSTVEREEQVLLNRILSSILGRNTDGRWADVEAHNFSPKVFTLLNRLGNTTRESLRGIVFVRERITASLLAMIISNHPITKDIFVAAPFVGSSNFPRKQTLLDHADIKAQNVALVDFRVGKKNLLVSTSVMEEGIDIPAVNLVVRYDHPANFRAFIQSRGRARQVESTFLFMYEVGDPAGSEQAWAALEEEMKMKYMDEMRQIAERNELEEADCGDYDEFLCSATTEARLSFHDAKQHLEHFCACLPTVPYADPPRPEYILDSSGDCLRADVILPPSVSMHPQRITGASVWKSEKMAKKDAAFRAYSQLYKLGLVNQNLLPTALPDPVILEIDAETEREESVISVERRLHPWAESFGTYVDARPSTISFSHEVAGEERYPQLHLFLPWADDFSMTLNLLWTVDQPILVKIEPTPPPSDLKLNHDLRHLGSLSTTLLLESIYLGKMRKEQSGKGKVPLLMMPSLDSTSLRRWVQECTDQSLEPDFEYVPLDSGLVRLRGWPLSVRPYIGHSRTYRTREDNCKLEDAANSATEELHLVVKRIPKRLNYVRAVTSQNFNTAVQVIPAADCQFHRFPATYAKVMLLVPSILHEIEIRKVAMCLNEDLLTSVAFSNIQLVEQAICASGANEQRNYQRLELIGDSILKFWTSAWLCARFPGWHEGYLSRGKDRIVSNLHLSWAARKLGLAKYICTNPFPGSRWRPPSTNAINSTATSAQQRKMSRKILADVVEALIGASSLDGQDEQECIVKVKASLTVLLKGVTWNSPAENASALRDLVPSQVPTFEWLEQMTEMTGYAFQKRFLLLEALTHPSRPPIGIQRTYQRLEFLGDSILDYIVVQEMATHVREIPHSIMHLIRSAVVNAHLLAFFCMASSIDLERVLPVETASEGFEITTTNQRRYLWQFMTHSGRVELVRAQKACARRFDTIGPQVRVELESGTHHPWCLLLSLRAEKFFSDIVESIIGAIFVDSEGNLQYCREFLERLGLMRYLRRILDQTIDLMHPKERLGIMSGRSRVRYQTAQALVAETLEYSSTVSVDDVPVATSAGEISRAAAEAKAAEMARLSLVSHVDQRKHMATS